MAYDQRVRFGRRFGDLDTFNAARGWFDAGRSVFIATLLFLAACPLPGVIAGARAATVAGVTSGSLSVDETGAATYTIPIAVPPGAAGMEPSLSFVYSSQSGNGPLGVGWSLGGLSNVHRCPRTLVQDGAVGGINFDANDRFCIDGQRLVAITGAYGGDGTEYRTEIDGFSKIVSYGTAGNGPAWFKVWTKSGQIMEYGATTDSRIEAQGRADVRLWAISKISDTVGNYLTVGYIEDEPNGEYRLDSIDYTLNDSAGVGAQSSAGFVYEARPDQITGYVAGSLVTTSQRVAKVQTYVGLTLVREYRLAYETGGTSGRSRLISMTECDGAGDCLSPVLFDGATGGGGTFTRSYWQRNNDPDGTVWRDGANPTYVIDLNGDGLQDLIQIADNTYQYQALISDGTGQFDQVFLQNDYPNDGTVWRSGIHSTYVIDLNGDGLQDLLQIANSTYQSQALISDGTGRFNRVHLQNNYPNDGTVWRASYGPNLVIDLNGDGLQDLLQIANDYDEYQALISDGTGQFNRVYWQRNNDPDGTVWRAGIHPTYVIDLNGDGLQDLLQITNGTYQYQALISDGTGQFNRVYHQNDYPNDGSVWRADYGLNLVIDLNGDGLQDLLQIANNYYQYQALISDGTGQFNRVFLQNDYPNDGTVWRAGMHPTYVIDLNGDGLQDLLQIANGTYQSQALISDGTGQFTRAHLQNDYPNDGTVWRADYGPNLVIDLDGDGLQDLLQIANDYDEYQALISDAPIPDILLSVTDSLGSQTDLTYTPITDDTIYTKDGDAVFPVIDIQAPLYVVSEVAQDDGLGGLARTDYAYGGAKVHLQGRGFLGFRWMEVTDQQTGIVTYTEYRQDHAFIGQVSYSETFLPGTPDDTFVNRLTNTWASTALNGGLTVFPYVSDSLAETFEVNDGPNNSPIMTASPNMTHDSFGNPTQTAVTTTGAGQSFVTTIFNTYNNDTTNWFHGRLTRAEVTNQLPDLSTATRVSEFSYDPTTGLLTQEAIEPGTALALTTDYVHDTFGNRTTTTVSGPDIVTRASTTTYTTDGRFPLTLTNALGHSETHAYDARFGTLVSLTGPNGLATTWSYDGFGRKVLEARADGTETTWSFDLCVSQCPTGGVYAVTRQNRITATSLPYDAIGIAYYDILNRVFRQETEGFDGTAIFADTEFNALGQVSRSSRPYFEGTLPANIQWTTQSYDLTGRLVSATTPDGGVTTSGFDGLSASSTNALGQTETRTKNAIGQLVQVVDPLLGTNGYAYDHFGNLEATTDAAGNQAFMDYDIRGRKVSMDDPDMGVWTYDYNALGELVGQTDAKLQTVTMAYDDLGRLVSRTEAEGVTTWTYDTAATGIGKLHQVAGPGGYQEVQSYDTLGRASQGDITIDGDLFTSSVTYDAASRVDTQTYPSGFAVQRSYTPTGFLADVADVATATVYWHANDVNAEGQVTEEVLGNGLITQRAYAPATGLVQSIDTWNGLDSVQALTVQFDLLGNLTSREDGIAAREETFAYDDLNRLIGTSLTDTETSILIAQTDYTYDSVGNITYKSDVGLYSYNGIGAGPHAVTAAGTETYDYDANGNMESGAGRAIGWSSFNKPTSIAAGSEIASFVYGPSRARIKQVITSGLSVKTVKYAGSLYEKHTRTGASDELVHYIRAGGTVAIYTEIDDGNQGTDKTRYPHQDHLGSITATTDETGAVTERLSFDPHGERRQITWEAAVLPIFPLETPRGFTGHEHLDGVGLIHMNGRVYDPVLGRFLSADPTVQFPASTQGLNRYTYVNNNPLSFTDPSGFGFFSSLFKSIAKVFKAVVGVVKTALANPYVRIAVAIAVAVIVPELVLVGIQAGATVTATAAVTASTAVGGPIGVGSLAAVAAGAGAAAGAAAASSIGAAVLAGAAGGFAAGFVGSGGDLQAAGIGALSGGALGFVGGSSFLGPVGQGIKSALSPLRIAAHGVIGGVRSALQGGKFLRGALTGVVAKIATPFSTAIGRGNPIAGALASAAVGGTASEIGGGKFANGALTGAYGYLFNEVISSKEFTSDLGKIRGNPLGAKVLHDLEVSKEKFYIQGPQGILGRLIDYFSPHATYEPTRNTITMTPGMYARVNVLNGGVRRTGIVEPDGVLFHELGHAHRDLLGLTGNNEEGIVIKNYENPYTGLQRYDHDGTGYCCR